MNADFHSVVMVVYDGIENSVFESQVVAPLLGDLETNPCLKVTLVSFERTDLPILLVSKKIPTHDRLRVVIAKKLPFLGMLSLRPALWQLIKFLQPLGCSELCARGPLAGWLVLRAVEKLMKKSGVSGDFIPRVTVQARGLAAEEYRYAMARSKRTLGQKIRDAITKKLLYRVEQSVYGYRGVIAQKGRFIIEAVSLALCDYLLQNFESGPWLTIAMRDITPSIDATRVAIWRSRRRGELGIAHNAQVYAYSGSFKPWQCARETVAYAADVLKKNPQAFFLVLTGDVEQFKRAIEQASIPADRYRVLCVSSAVLTEYLAAADAGFLLREADVINWVSRPTKMMEYQAVGLEIIHNDTVACLQKNVLFGRAN